MNAPHRHEDPEPHFSHADERRAAGKALRDQVARDAHSHWKAPRQRRDIIGMLEVSNQGRMENLVPIRYGRMMESPFAFFRGSADIRSAILTFLAGASWAGVVSMALTQVYEQLFKKCYSDGMQDRRSAKPQIQRSRRFRLARPYLSEAWTL